MYVEDFLVIIVKDRYGDKMAKFCTNCGSPLEEEAKACGNCGTFIDGSVNIYAENNNGNNVGVQGNFNGANNGYNNNNVNNGNVNTKNTADYGTIGFVTSLVSIFFCCGSLNFISLIFSIIGLIESKNNQNVNRNLAIAGIVISCLWYAFLLVRLFGEIFSAAI